MLHRRWTSLLGTLLLIGCTLSDTGIRRGTPITHVQADLGVPDAISDASGDVERYYLPTSRPVYEWPADAPRTFYYLDRDLAVTFVEGRAVRAKRIDDTTRDAVSSMLNRHRGISPPATSRRAIPVVPAVEGRDADFIEFLLRDDFESTDRGETVFVSLGSIKSGWKDPAASFLRRFADLPLRVRPVSEARFPTKYEMETPNRYRGVEDPETGRRSTVHWVEIQRWESDTKVRVDTGSYSGPLGGGGMIVVYEFRDGQWIPTAMEEGWVS